jgi:DNA-binding CsgD family transcriptional regulator
VLGGRAALERALGIAQSLDDPSLIAEIAGSLSTFVAWLGDLERSRQYSQLRIDQALRAQDVFELRHAHGWIGTLYMMEGRWDEAWHAFEQQETYVDAMQSAEPLATLCSYRARYHYLRGEFDEGMQQIERALDLISATNSGVRIWFLGILAILLGETGPDDRARTILAELEEIGNAFDSGTPPYRYVMTHRVLLSTRLGLRSDAAACYSRLLPFRGTLTPILTDRVLGLAAWSAGNIEAAHEHFTVGTALATQFGFRPELALVLLNHAALARAQGSPVDAGDLEERGLRLAEELGMTALGAQALRPLDLRRRQPAERPAGLTTREIEVIRLISQGLTNRQIAEQLFISEKTVARHLTPIYAKTGVDNRAGAAAFAFRSGLA